MRLRRIPLPSREEPLNYLTIDQSVEYVLPRIRAAADPNHPGSYIRVGEWGARWNPWGDPRWFETTSRLQGVVSPLRKGVVGEYYTGYLEGRCIGRVVIAESAIAYEVENSELYEPLEIAAVGIAKYIDGFYDFLDDRIIREVEVPGAIDEDRRRHDEMINHILYGNWNE